MQECAGWVPPSDSQVGFFAAQRERVGGSGSLEMVDHRLTGARVATVAQHVFELRDARSPKMVDIPHGFQQRFTRMRAHAHERGFEAARIVFPRER